MKYIEDIRQEFRHKKATQQYRGDTIEIQNAQFRVDSPVIFGTANQKYIDAELEWYDSRSLNVNDLFKIYGKKVKIWDDISDTNGYVNSNYGWCVYSDANGQQFEQVKATLQKDPLSRQAVMIYTNPNMHQQSTWDGRRDFMCTTHVQYFINPVMDATSRCYLEASVYMRSNDAIFGFINDVAWQREVLFRLADDLNLNPGSITWNAGSLHVYKRHWDLIT